MTPLFTWNVRDAEDFSKLFLHFPRRRYKKSVDPQFGASARRIALAPHERRIAAAMNT
jgi:hypothetical protein